MPTPRKFTLSDLRAARAAGRKTAMLTCYDYTTARHMQDAGVRMLLVGDSAANVILGHDTTLPITLDFLITLTAAVRRGAPKCLLVADMPFGSYHQSVPQGVKNVVKMMQLSGCDCVKLETSPNQTRLVRALADAGVAVMVHLGLRPQSVNLLGGYRAQGRTAQEIKDLVRVAANFERAGAAAILLEAVPPQAAAAVVEATAVPVIGCGAGQACHGHVVVTQDALGLTPSAPKFVPRIADMAVPMKAAFADYVRQVESGEYPGPQHEYQMNEPVHEQQPTAPHVIDQGVYHATMEKQTSGGRT
jgi:3-methyl-2-oxobutanoate hydroxymethyltransferase